MPRSTQNASKNAAQQYQNSEGATNPPKKINSTKSIPSPLEP